MSKRLHTGHLVALGVNSIVGSGIFIVPGLAAAYLGFWSVAAFLACGALLHIIALCYVRLARLTSRNGGPYAYAALALGPNAAFAVGWVSWISAVVSATAVGYALGAYLSPLLGQAPSPTLDRGVAISAIALLGVINHLGVRYGGGTMAALTLAKLIPLLALGVSGLFMVHPSTLTMGAKFEAAGHGWSHGILLILFTCQGFEVVPYIAGESSHPTSQVPKAIVLSLWISIFVFALLQLGILAGPAVGSVKPLVDQARFLWGPRGEMAVALAGVLSIFGFLSGISLAAPRLLAPLCEDRCLPSSLARLDPRFNTPVRSIWLTSLASMAFVGMGGLGELVELSSLTVILEYLATASSLLALSRGMDRGARRLALAGLTISLLFLTQVSLKSWLVMGITVLAGLLLRYLSRRFERR